jgi:hypothetical protein
VLSWEEGGLGVGFFAGCIQIWREGETWYRVASMLRIAGVAAFFAVASAGVHVVIEAILALR